MSLDFALIQSSAAPGVFFCDICSKPFIQETALKRHLPYCRRTRARPRVRPTPCRACSAAKCKCSMQPRCARCTKKGIDCVYPGAMNEGPDKNGDASIRAISTPGASSSGPPGFPSSLLSAPERFSAEDQFQWGATSQAFDMRDGMLFADFPSLEPGVEFMSANLGVNVTDMSFTPGAYELVMPSSISRDKGVVPQTTMMVFPLRYVSSVNPVGESSANMIRQALRAFPQMMLRRSIFPPFIHPYQDKSHLPEPLATCMSIGILFASRNQETRRFLWKSVREEQERNLREMTNQTKHTIFASLQAQLIYIIMRVVDGGGSTLEDRDYNTNMLSAYEAFWKHFMTVTDTTCGADSAGSTSWEDWTLRESSTRVACIWFLVAQVASVKVGFSCAILDAWRDLALPCHKAQWAATTPESWEEETKALHGLQKRGNGITSFGELLECHRAADLIVNAEKLDAWNSGADNIGSLLNLATTMI